MESRLNELDTFFDHYADVFNNALNGNNPDPEEVAQMFASHFIAANPFGVIPGQNDISFREAMEKGYAHYRSIGIEGMKIISKNITILDSYHALVRVLWKSHFTDHEGKTGSIDFENIYFIQTLGSVHKIFAYITGDEQAALKNAGLV